MNSTAFWIALLALWIFFLQSKVKHLEKIVEGLKPQKEKPTPMQEVPTKQEQKIPITPLPKYSKPPKLPKPKQPKEPSKILHFITNYFTQGNPLVRIGAVILFFGLAFLVKYTIAHTVISIEVRLFSVAVVAGFLIILGWKLKDKEGAYGQVLQGLGIAILYLLIYASAKFYTLFSLDIAFVLMLGVLILGSILAVIEDAFALALFSTIGGFCVPILTASPEGSHIVLFSYYALLNLGIFSIAWYRSWRMLNIVGFVFTFMISGFWGIVRYSPELFASTEPFLLLYFAMYLSISILFTIKHPYEPKNLVDATLVFGLPVIAFPLQLKLVAFYDYGDAYSAVALGLLYLLLFFRLKNIQRTQLLAQSFLALAVVFLTISVPYIFDANVASVLWALESTGIIWLALKQNKTISRYFAMLLLAIATVNYPSSLSGETLLWSEYFGYIVLISSLFITSFLLDTHRPKLPSFDRFYGKFFLLIAFVLWFYSTSSQLLLLGMTHSDMMLGALLVLTPILLLIIRFSHWHFLTQVLEGYFYLGVFLYMPRYITAFLLENGINLGIFSLFILGNYALLYSYRKVWKAPILLHILSLWIIARVGIIEVLSLHHTWQIEESLRLIMMVLFPLFLNLLILIPSSYKGWLEEYRSTYQYIASAGLVLFMFFWTLVTFATPYTPTQMPLLNILDFTQVLILANLYYWIHKNSHTFTKSTRQKYLGIFALLIFLFVNVLWARSIQSMIGIDYAFSSLWHNSYFQTGLSILWTLMAIFIMLLSKRYESRPLWIIGFSSLIVVVLKLFVIELAHSGSIQRIVSFIVVGVLLLIIGYLVPLPPNKEEEANTESDT